METHSRSTITDKQYRIMVVICDGNGRDDDGTFNPVDLDQLLDRLSYRTTKQSMQFSIRPLIKRGLIVKGSEVRRGAKRVTYVPTKTGKQMMGYHDPSFVESTDLAYLDV